MTAFFNAMSISFPSGEKNIIDSVRAYDLQALEAVYLDRLDKTKKNPQATPRVMLASTVSAEHFTASFGENILNDNLLGGCPRKCG